MPSATSQPALSFTPLHPTFGASVEGMKWEAPVPQHVTAEILDGVHKYGVLVFRKANLDNEQHIEFSRQFGELDDVKAHIRAGRAMRFPHQPEIFDVSNLDEKGNVLTDVEPARLGANKGNLLWHADMAYNPQRCSYSLLRAVELPPKGTGGETQYLDSRTAYEDMPEQLRAKIDDLITNNSLMHNRKLAAPDIFKDVEPLDMPMSRHRLVQLHEDSGRKNLYVTTYAHHFDGVTMEESKPLLDELLAWVSQPKYMLTVSWENDGDLVMWDNRAVLHRATATGSYGGKHRRDMRRTTVKDGGNFGWGENGVGCSWQAGLSK
ncbi:Alpha-ketoglutarate-dependent 2,4-dichlorophenoxyacetate dioxygenase [Colletotrichum siamense]|uniref:Alpha-ketoglutarate-dependent 2,4-dichlorophenoxyacetate dioxygenase n=1 Tax=Colletotrichum siamense TaxID=690259 RepID=A0A9P5K5V5_COLSI|nr:Alpha-ketoglutarate-dependent 2,4-dichlorophenoxyacetate dioxygenase [Colletotrichum siamense]KAF4860101.1 Alpha-ketoglutarate-dependent 2,4-dichlorophenoxyacetate dioxygenase [Colletotrichum siamense]